ncbi:MAG: DNA-binding protein [Planctomycetes bacterium]|nr:DNA-binding protein [Planctomycetota bacterium]
MATATVGYTTPPKFAKLLGVDADKILAFIRTGQLAAVNLAVNPQGKPRYRIALADAERFLQSRATTPPAAKPRRRRRTIAAPVKEYF